MRIPNIFHFCYFGGRPFNLVNYLAVKATYEVNRPEEIKIHLENEPSGDWWNRAKNYLSVIKIKPIQDIFGHKVMMPAHKADYWRIKTLVEEGGIYLDLDVICNKPFDVFRNEEFVMGEERANGQLIGLNNSVLLSRPGTSFVKRWLEGFDPERSLWKGFRSGGFDLYYTEISVKYPMFLSQYWANELRVEPFESFFGVNWTEKHLRDFFENQDGILPDSFVFHLWESSSYDKYIKDKTLAEISIVRTPFARVIQRFI